MITKKTNSMGISLMILEGIILFLTPIWLILAGHYFFYPMPSLFDFPSLIPTVKQPALMFWSQINFQQTFYNILIVSLFFIQHVIMATLKYKLQNQKIWKNYPFYQRIIYNLISSLLLPIVLYYTKPQNYIVFTLKPTICFVLALIGWLIWIQSNLRVMGRQFLPYSFRSLLYDKQLFVQNQNQKFPRQLVQNGSYAYIRHPMVTGFWLFFTFANHIFTFQKIIIMAIFLIGMIIGSLMEQKKLIKTNPLYTKYMQNVKYRYIPFVI